MKTASSANSKSDKIFHIAACALSLDVSEGHLRWKVTDLERKSKVSRSLIYRYLGGDKKSILQNSMEIFVSQFYGLEKKTVTLTFAELVSQTRQWAIDYPETILFYQKNRAASSELKEAFVRVEEKFQKKLKKIFPHFSAEELLVAHACIHGVVTAPFLSAQQTSQICAQLIKKGILT